jgi:hypothetical protein
LKENVILTNLPGEKAIKEVNPDISESAQVYEHIRLPAARHEFPYQRGGTAQRRETLG